MLNETLSRRAFLKASGALVVTFSLAHPLARAASLGTAPKTVAADQVDGFLAIDSNGRVTVYSGKVDLGTGVYTALTQIAAEELCVPLDRVHLVQGDTALTPDQGITWGSLTIQVGGVQIRRACATAREALLARAAQKLGAPKENLEARDGQVLRTGGGAGVSYAELIGDDRFEMKVDEKAPLKAPATYTIVGKPIRRFDIPAKVSGRFTYMQDVKVPDMLHARVVRPSGLKAELIAVDESAARKIPGYVATVRKGNFLAAVAKDEWAAIRCANALKAQWSDWQGLPDPGKLWDYVRATKVVKDEVFQSVGNAPEAMKTGAKTLAATYDFAIHTHGSIGPSCAIADYKDGRLTVWSASQATHLLRKQLANMLSMKQDNVRCLYVEGAGCYGRNGHEDATCDAALISKLIGKPVRVQWMREDEHGWDPKGPPTLVEITAGLDARGDIVGWDAELWVPKADITEWPRTLAVTLAGMPQADAINPGNVHRNLDPSYPFAHQKAVAHRLESTPFRPSWIRTPGRMQNTYANEVFIDECAAAAGADPVAYRLRYLTDPRGIAVLRAAASMAKWDPRPSPRREQSGPIARGRGIAYVKYENVRTYCACVAEVEVNRQTGAIRCTRFHVAHDCGQIINPDGVRAQIEGQIIQTTSRTLKEELKWNRSRVTSVDWASYPILRFPDVPEVHMELINRPNDPPWGVGEPAACLPPPAISNAVFDAIGVRLRSVPFTAPKVMAAVRGAGGKA